MLRRFLLATALAAPVLFTACDEDGTGPEGTPSAASVHAYVDADGTGNISAGDLFIPGATITLTDTDGAETHTAQTNASGVALFESLHPGSYTVTMSGGTVPSGAVLASATTPTLVAPFRGDSVAAEFRYVLNPGSVSGRLFRDNNNNNVFDTGDTPAPGIPVALYAGSEASGTAVATTTTDAQGAFTFSTLRPGTYTYRFNALPTMTIQGGATQTITVGSGDPTPALIEFTGNLISPIGEIRDLPLQSGVAVVGVVTVGNGVLSGSQFYVQDATGGILVFGALTPGTQTGDSVRVVGVMGAFSGESQIVAPAGGTLSVEKLGTGTVPAPRLQTVDAVLTGDTEGQLVRVPNVEVVSVSGTATSSSYNVVVKDPAGTLLTIRVAAATVGVPQPTWIVGRKYDVTGVVSMFNGVPQVKPRSLADVTLRSAGTPIGAVRAMAFADSAGTRFDTVTVEGVVHTAQGTFRTDNAFIQDPTGGILLFNVPAGAGLVVGDSVRVTAAIDWFNGELELVRFSSTSPPVIEKLGTGATPLPRTISGTQFNSRAYEGQLVRVANAVVDSIGTASSSGGYTVWLDAPDGARIQVRIENNSIGIPLSSWTVGSVVNVVGALSSFRGVPQVKPRNAADVTAGSAGTISIAAAKALPNGDTVTVEGVVTAPIGIFNTSSNRNAYIDDGTAGIQIFGIPTDVTLNVGDVIRVTGLTGAFSGEEQISRFSSTSLLQVTKLGEAATPSPRPVSGAEVLARTFEGSLVRLDSVVVTAVGTVSSSGGYNVTVTTADGSTVTVRVDREAVAVPVSTWVVGGVYDVTGILSAFNSAPQLKVRSLADVVRR